MTTNRPRTTVAQRSLYPARTDEYRPSTLPISCRVIMCLMTGASNWAVSADAYDCWTAHRDALYPRDVTLTNEAYT